MTSKITHMPLSDVIKHFYTFYDLSHGVPIEIQILLEPFINKINELIDVINSQQGETLK